MALADCSFLCDAVHHRKWKFKGSIRDLFAGVPCADAICCALGVRRWHFSICKQGIFWGICSGAQAKVSLWVVFFPFFLSSFLPTLEKANCRGTLNKCGCSHTYWLCRDLKAGLISCNGQTWDLARMDFFWGHIRPELDLRNMGQGSTRKPCT